MRYSRQNKIIEIINNNEVDTQEKLAALLRESGYEVTQATISRDIKELQLVKTLSSSGKYKYATSASKDSPVSDRFIKIFRETITSFKDAENIIVVKTLSGCANAAAEAVDSYGMPHIVGSIAGDNTFILIVDCKESVPEVMAAFDEMLYTRAKND
ncbi:MAG: arginine repressor [Firmicutes bacterium]|nr:arginine repressor [Bacillota bacterium]MBR1989565.1 arginine repressor [Bacillota bacterium]